MNETLLVDLLGFNRLFSILGIIMPEIIHLGIRKHIPRNYEKMTGKVSTFKKGMHVIWTKKYKNLLLHLVFGKRCNV